MNLCWQACLEYPEIYCKTVAQIQPLMSNYFTEEEMMNILKRDCCRIVFPFLNGLRWFHIYNTNATQPLVYSASLRLSLDLYDDEDMVVETGPGE